MDFRTASSRCTLGGVSTSYITLLALVLPISAGAFSACSADVVLDDEGDADGNEAGGGAAPLTCEVEPGPIELVPVAGNPPQCLAAQSCEVWFGHGQHMSCPYGIYESPPFVECSIWDCLCTVYEEEGFVANFATGEVIDTRDPGLTCRYRLTPVE